MNRTEMQRLLRQVFEPASKGVIPNGNTCLDIIYSILFCSFSNQKSEYKLEDTERKAMLVYF